MNESKRKLWEARILEQESSGLTIEEWCMQQQLKTPSFYYWKRKIQQRCVEQEASHLPMFAEVELQTPPSGAGRCPGLSVSWKEFHFLLLTTEDIRLAVQFIRQLQMP